MATYAFESITAGQALSFSATSDTLSFGNAASTGARTSVVYGPASTTSAATVSITDLTTGRTIVFGTTADGGGILGEGGRPGEQGLYADGSSLFVGTAGADNVTGTASGDGFFGGQGDDSLSAIGGDDLLQGNQGDDHLDGGAGDDTIFGGQGNDSVAAGAGVNFVNGNLGDDTISGADGGANTLLGGQQNDSLLGGGGADFLNGNLGDDTIEGGGGNDLVFGEAGSDSLQGGLGADTLVGGAGADVLQGGGGSDVFLFSAGQSGLVPASLDRIVDWTGGSRTSPVDHIDFSNLAGAVPLTYLELTAGDFAAAKSLADLQIASGYDYVAVQVGADVVVFVDSAANNGGADDALVLVGRSLADVDYVNFAG